MRAEVLCIGTELLIGQVVNTNATYLAGELAALGIDLLWVTTVGDNFERLGASLTQASGRADLVLMTGGLGPTPDDITVEAISGLLGAPLEERSEARAHIENYFKLRKRPMAPSNLKMALFPASSTLIPNPTGTAYGVEAFHGPCRLMAFPGVPMELKAMWQSWARPRLAALAEGTIRSVLLKYVGIGESNLAEQVAPLLDGTNPTVAPYAKDAEVHLRVTAKAASDAEAQAMLAPVVAQLQGIAPYYYGQDEESLPGVVGKCLQARREAVATAESCTGGLLASRLTDVAGASNHFPGGLVTYATEVKAEMLGVPQALIDANGVVSSEVAGAMAEHAKRVFNTAWGVATTGYASPGPNVPAEDEGLVWVAVAGPTGTAAEPWRYGSLLPREAIKYRATQAALDLLRRRLLESASPCDRL